jgi:hypothetical protein
LSVPARGGRTALYDPVYGSELLERITARRAELDELEEQLAKQLAEVRAERDELAVAEKVLERMSEQLAEERASAGPAPGQVGGRAVMMIPHRTAGGADLTDRPLTELIGVSTGCWHGAGMVLVDLLSQDRNPVIRDSTNLSTAQLACDQGRCRPGGAH